MPSPKTVPAGGAISPDPAARAEMGQVRVTIRVTRLASTVGEHSAGYLGYCGYRPG
jgi:hypothetical protein